MYSLNSNLNNHLKIWLLALLSLIILVILVGGLTRLTDSGLSITTWELFVGFVPPLTNEKWIDYNIGINFGLKLWKKVGVFTEYEITKFWDRRISALKAGVNIRL